MKLHREGYTIIIYSFILLTGIGIFANQVFPKPLFFFAVLVLMVILGLIIQFFRVPYRTINAEKNQVICPADGKIVVIEEVHESEFIAGKCRQISIFMSPLNVHANYFPMDGKVIYTKYHPGKYLVAWHPKSSTENERSTTVIETHEHKKVLVRQIAGALARRICCYAQENQVAHRGEELGFIKFGSRVDVFLPLDATIHVVLGQSVKNRQDILATL